MPIINTMDEPNEVLNVNNSINGAEKSKSNEKAFIEPNFFTKKGVINKRTTSPKLLADIKVETTATQNMDKYTSILRIFLLLRVLFC